jgi:NADPH-dependent 7-cyano-7-deazaguanine reductase QueF
MTQADDLLHADTSGLTMLGRPVERLEGERPGLECFRTRLALTKETHRTREWVSLPPGPNGVPDVYEVTIVYAPRDGQVLEAKTLREYALSFKTTQAAAHALAVQVADDVLAATDARWVEVTFRNLRSGEGARTSLRPDDYPVEAADEPDEPMLGRPVEPPEGARPRLACVTAAVAPSGEHQTHEQLHETYGWVSQCPVAPFLTDIYHVTVAYAPHAGRVLDPTYLWEEYAASFRDTKAFAEALAGQVANDVLAATDAYWVEVTFVQNIRGGWEIEAFQRLPEGDARPNRSE